MDDLVFIAVGPDGRRREWTLTESPVLIGREDGTQEEGRIGVPADPRLSRRHFTLQPDSPESVRIERHPNGRNPLFFNGTELDEFLLAPGQVFYTGKTQFGLIRRSPTAGTIRYTLAQESKEQARLRRLQDCLEAVMELLAALRANSDRPPWRVAFPVIRSILPDVEQVLFLEFDGGSGQSRLVDQDPPGADYGILEAEMLSEALLANSTTTFHWERPAMGPGTLEASSMWAVASPIRGLEGATFFLCALGKSFLAKEALEERAAIVDLVSELVGHHQVVQQGAEYSSLLGVFGHHVGTLFKTSGALGLWSDQNLPPEVKRVFDNLLPIWGISQAISLHKKRGEKERRALMESWVRTSMVESPALAPEIEASLEALVRHVYHSQQEAPFLRWQLNGEPLDETTPGGLKTLPPLDDSPRLFDKTLALTIGLLEMLTNVRKYPEARGAGREDRRELGELSQEQRCVRVSCRVTSTIAEVEVLQPIVTAPDGTVPRSRSLDRIRALETSLLGGLVATSQAELVGSTELEHILMIRFVWSYHWARLIEEWGSYHG